MSEEKKSEQKVKQEEKEENKQEEEKKTKEEKPHLLDEPVRVNDYIYLMILSLEGKAWAYMDLVVHPETQKHKKDPEQARLAIDAIEALYRIVEGQLSPEQKKDLQTRLTNLRLNFAKK